MSEQLTILEGDALARLRELPDETFHCVVTSPPYWGLRDYGVEGQIGLEETPEAYLTRMVEVFQEVRRVLRGDGVCWVNMGDSYAHDNPSGPQGKNGDRASRTFTANGAGGMAHGLKPKDLCGMPWRLALALQADGWWLRQDIIWAKPNPMPESVTDRCTKAHEYVFLLTKAERYFYDAEAVKEPANEDNYRSNPTDRMVAPGQTKQGKLDARRGEVQCSTRNRRSVWTITTEPYPEAHFATFPTELPKLCILAGTSARGCCPKCGAPWERVQEYQKGEPDSFNGSDFRKGKKALSAESLAAVGQGERTSARKTVGWMASCDCENPRRDTVPCRVLDPFGGSGTTGQVALELGRHATLIELNPAYVKLAWKRCHVTPGLQLA